MKDIILKSLSVGRIKSYSCQGEADISAIGKQKIESTFLSINGFQGDEVAAPEYHGGPDRAVCLYPFEHYQQWGEEFQKEFIPPSFGENICVSGMTEDEVFIGDIYQFGEATIQISQGRVPCAKISNYNGEAGLLGRIVNTGFTGYFFRVLDEGAVNIHSPISLLDRTQTKVSVLEANYVLFHDYKNKQAISKILEVSELADVWRQKLEKLL